MDVTVTYPLDFRRQVEDQHLDDPNAWDNTVYRLLRAGAVIGMQHAAQRSIMIEGGHTIDTTPEALDRYSFPTATASAEAKPPPDGFGRTTLTIGTKTARYLRYSCAILAQTVPGLARLTLEDLIQTHVINSIRNELTEAYKAELLEDTPDIISNK